MTVSGERLDVVAAITRPGAAIIAQALGRENEFAELVRSVERRIEDARRDVAPRFAGQTIGILQGADSYLIVATEDDPYASLYVEVGATLLRPPGEISSGTIELVDETIGELEPADLIVNVNFGDSTVLGPGQDSPGCAAEDGRDRAGGRSAVGRETITWHALCPSDRPKEGCEAMASLASLEMRIRALEARLAEVEGGYGDTLYRLHREALRSRIEVGRLLEHSGIPRASDDIDALLEAE